MNISRKYPPVHGNADKYSLHSIFVQDWHSYFDINMHVSACKCLYLHLNQVQWNTLLSEVVTSCQQQKSMNGEWIVCQIIDIMTLQDCTVLGPHTLLYIVVLYCCFMVDVLDKHL